MKTDLFFRRAIFAGLLLTAAWRAALPQTVATISDDGARVLLGGRVVLDNRIDGFMSVRKILYSPDQSRIAVIGCGFECNDNIGLIIDAGGSGKRKFTAKWDFILQDALEWSSDGKKLYYYRINSTGASAPRKAPAEGWVEVDVASGRKSTAASRTLKTGAGYRVISSLAREGVKVYEAPRSNAKVVGALPSDAKDIIAIGGAKLVSRERRVAVVYQNLLGWANQNFLLESGSPLYKSNEIGLAGLTGSDAIRGCGCFLRGSSAPQGSKDYIFAVKYGGEERHALANIDGRDVRLKSVSDAYPKGKLVRGNLYAETFENMEIKAHLLYQVAKTPAPGEEVTAFEATIVIVNGSRIQIYEAVGSCGC